jgi:alpha-glucosidase (family GH31 glycosyl hydrolase)
LYGHHPVGLIRDSKGKFFLVLQHNSNAMDIVVGDNPPSVGYKIVGGVLDLVFFLGDEKPDTALRNYHEYIGKFVVMPFWSMGYHQCRWGYRSADRLEEIVNKFRSYDIPLDVIWSDIDYMVDKEDFNIDTRNFNPTKMTKLFES